MKKMIAMALTAATALSLITGCGSNSNEAASSEAEVSSSAAKETAESETVSGAAEETAASEAASSEAESAASEAEEAAEDSDWEYISGNGKLIIGMTLFAPMNYYDDSNTFVGFDTELATAVCEKLGLEVEFVEINWDSKEVELSSKNIDCIWNGMCITEERKENMSISDPYLYNTQAMVMKADREEEIMANVDGLTVVAEQGSTGEGKMDGSIPDDETVEVSAQEYFANTNYVACDSMAKALLEVKSGTADVAVVDSVCALAMVGEGTDYDDMVVNLDNNFGAQEYGIAFRKGSDTTAKVNEAIQELYDEGVVAEIAEKYGLTEMLIQR